MHHKLAYFAVSCIFCEIGYIRNTFLLKKAKAFDLGFVIWMVWVLSAILSSYFDSFVIALYDVDASWKCIEIESVGSSEDNYSLQIIYGDCTVGTYNITVVTYCAVVIYYIVDSCVPNIIIVSAI